VIGTRTATALAFLLSIAAVAFGVVALAVSLRDDEDGSNLVQTRVDRVDGAPVPFPLHDFYLSGDARGVPRALYMYPPGYFGHVRGCKVIWVAEDAIEADGVLVGPGLFVDPCGGARFDREGRLVAGQADRGLDRFDTRSDVGGAVVDISTLRCGIASDGERPVVPAQSPTPSPPPTLPPSPPLAPTVAPPQPQPSLTPTVASSATPSVTATATVDATAEAETCDFVETD
jgi:hypothetical protein